tara:strand:+ start:341 stop:751 length:411 start_codon:yes stop_codon:yes gene_type:complete
MADGLGNVFTFLTTQCENAALGFETAGIVRPFAMPDPEEDYTEDSMISLFDRQEYEDKYSEAVNAGDTEDIHADMMVPTLKNDIVAGMHRDVFLRHTRRIGRFVAEAYRRKNHSVNVHPKREKAINMFENLQRRED